MAEAVAHAFDTGEHLAVQAGTGTGKSLAYLVPAHRAAVAHRRARGGVDGDDRAAAPARRPRPARASPTRWPMRCRGEPTFALLKGRGNYLCLNKIHNGSAAETRTTGRRRSCSTPAAAPRSAATCSG